MAGNLRYDNPFTPSFGEVPLYMAGRTRLINELIRALESPRRHPGLTTCVSGARGTGKTALLTLVAHEAEQRGWVCASATAIPGMLEDIFEQTVDASSHLVASTGADARVTGVGIGEFLRVEWEAPSRKEGNWRTRMSGLLDALAQNDTGLLITVDEVRADLDEMILLAAVYQHFVREGRRVGLLMAGLPFNVSQLLQDKSVSFLRRAQGAFLGRIADLDVELAFTRTITRGGRSISADALSRAVKAIAGFPFMLQLVGFRAWDQAPEEAEISYADTEAGIELAKREMRERILPATCRELSSGDVKFLKAMLPDEDVSSTADIASRLGRSSSYVSQYRRRLMEQGVIGERGRGYVGFEVPMMREYLQEEFS